MKLISIIIFRWKDANQQPKLLSSAYDVSNFGIFQRSSVREVALFVSREVVSRSIPGDRHSVTHQGHLCHVHITPDHLAGAVISDEDYPQRVAFSLISAAMEAFLKLHIDTWKTVKDDVNLNVPELEPLLLKYQDPTEADKIMKIQKDLDITKDILIKSIDQLLERGEKLDDLAKKSNDLSFQSKVFMDKSSELNSCCTIL
eukprot:TRINITY_DN18071_c0_g1_i1.p1 TRINITY_DN18071_c0_g1~~TRINITY_DN18071_c0_g1_i1.p1  ORF type:complete len:201 (-),score=43.40 TRINITY_DN18071_c0_g1_i1:75-677(-)